MPTLSTLRRGASRFVTCTPLRLSAFLALSLVAGFAVLAQAGAMNDFHDAQFLAAYERHARIAVTRFYQLPLWDPYSCGGLYGLAAPQTRYASPFFLLSLLFGVDRASALLFVLLPALGMEGQFRYARRWGALAFPAFLLAPAFGLCGWFAEAFQFGWVQFLSFALVPWILLGLRGALRGERGSALSCAVAVAITIGFGGTYTLPMALVPCAVELVDAALPSLVMWWRRGRAAYASLVVVRVRRLLAGLAVLLGLSLGLGAYRLWPLLESMEATLRVMGGEPRLALRALVKLVFVAATEKSEHLGHFYFAPTLAVLALLARPRGKLALCVGTLIAFVLAAGHFAPLAPFALLRRLPIYETLRYPERYLLLFVLSASVLAALGATRLCALARRRRGRWWSRAVPPLLLLLGVVGSAQAGANVAQLVARVHLAPTPVEQASPFRQSRGNRWLMSHFAAEGMGSLGCGEAYPLPMSTHLRGDLPAEEYLVAPDGGPARGEAERLDWSPNALTVSVRADAPVRLAINQNHHPGWWASEGEVASWDGLLSVLLPAGEHRVTLRFLPRSGLGGLLASLLGLVGGVWYVARRPRTRAGRVLAVGAGPLTVIVLLTLWSEAPWRRPEPLTDTGAPVLLTALPPEAQKLAVRFDVPLALVGVTLPSAPLPAQARELPLELFFTRSGPLSASLGLFVHLFGPEGGQERGDHTSISGRVYLPRLPLGMIGRDALSVPLPESARGEWEVRVGAWNTHGDGARRRITSSDAPVDTDAVVVGRVRVGLP